MGKSFVEGSPTFFSCLSPTKECGRDSLGSGIPGWNVPDSSPVPLKTRHVEETDACQICRGSMSPCWGGGGGCQFRFRPRHLTEVQNDEVVANSSRNASESDVINLSSEREEHIRLKSIQTLK
ncbi:hypothetical protein TNCV_4415421 [Trichonephila clavipes]|uniref:Uncharacterized protein n=1 Tax=Trichonephila clavipes TaxID=2585209 RepID=A0A8X6S086_TRICX|nr:hypothetical protein TNCV_4415421 [Trichonephila clavipes]